MFEGKLYYTCTKITEVNLSAFAYMLFHKDLSWSSQAFKTSEGLADECGHYARL